MYRGFKSHPLRQYLSHNFKNQIQSKLTWCDIRMAVTVLLSAVFFAENSNSLPACFRRCVCNPMPVNSRKHHQLAVPHLLSNPNRRFTCGQHHTGKSVTGLIWASVPDTNFLRPPSIPRLSAGHSVALIVFYSKIGASFASTSSMTDAGKVSTLRALRAPRSSMRG